jgi:hypothetical protein
VRFSAIGDIAKGRPGCGAIRAQDDQMTAAGNNLFGYLFGDSQNAGN